MTLKPVQITLFAACIWSNATKHVVTTPKTTAITGVRSITHLYRGGEGWTHPLYLISYEWIFLNNLLQLTNMKLFAALERALLARWRKIKVALKVNK